MHTTIFTSLRHYLRTRFPHLSSDVLDGARGDGSLSPDERFRQQVHSVARAARVDEQELLHGFGQFATENTFKHMYRDYYTECSGTKEFLLNVENRIHEAVRRSIPGAAPPQLRVSAEGEKGVSIAYTSHRRLCELVPGLVQGVAGYYHEPVTITEPTCMKRGDRACVFSVAIG